MGREVLVMEPIPMNREAWLNALVEKLRPLFREHGYELPERIRVSCGWPSDAGRAKIRRHIGEAWHPRVSADGSSETFISPAVSDPVEVADIMVHELVHHAVGTACMHKGPFRRLALAVGLTGRMHATVAGPALRERLHAICAELGPYPHAAITGEKDRKQATRMRKVECPGCGCIVRMTRSWLERIGAPTCGCGMRMLEADVKREETS
jgi:hypothetical protein